MATQLTITIEEVLTPEMLEALRYLFADAFAEFQYPRRDAVAYVDKRYPLSETSPFKGERRDKKIEEVRMRVLLAEVIRGASLRTLEIKATAATGEVADEQ